jgi:hypothetical protein
MSAKRDPVGRIFLLLAEGFSEVQATLLISELRGAGLPLKTVGLTRRPVRSEHGVKIVPDLSIDAVIQTPLQVKLLILPGGKATVSAWRADPRIRVLLDLVQHRGGYLVATNESIEMLAGAISPALSLRLFEELPVPQNTASSALPVLVAPANREAFFKEFAQELVGLYAK